MSAGTSVELPKELWLPLSRKIDRLVVRIDLIALAVDGLHHGADVLPHDNMGAVDTAVVALNELKDELSALIVAAGRVEPGPTASAVNLRSHLQGVRIECEYAEGGSRG